MTMVTKMFAVYDNKAMAYGTPFCAPAAGVAARQFTELANDPGTMVCKYPEDFTLFQIGEYDDAIGVIAPLREHVNLGLAAAFKNPLEGLPMKGLTRENGRGVEVRA